MTLDQSLFVSDTVHEKQVKLADGSKHTLYFRELPASEYRKFQIVEMSDNDDVRSTGLAKLIAASLCEPDGKPAITVDKALKLKPIAMNAIFLAIAEVNGYGKTAKKD